MIFLQTLAGGSQHTPAEDTLISQRDRSTCSGSLLPLSQLLKGLELCALSVEGKGKQRDHS